MAVAAYYQWDSLGRPLEPARPIRDIVERMKVAYPMAAGTFSWHANEAHYTAVPPQDHTPFSATGWPYESPEWWVFATDIMHNPALGVDCNVLFGYWIAEAKAGRMPWLKYVIWQAKLYDVRNGWRPRANSGHFDHVHLSARTDFKDRGLGDWSIVPHQEGNMLIRVNETGAIWTVDADRHWRRYIDKAELDQTWAGVPYKAVAKAQVDAGWYGRDIATLPAKGDPPAPEALAAVSAAAEKGAETGAGGPTPDELEQAAFEGSQRAERE